MKNINRVYFKTVIFGLQDALVSTTGVVVGIAAGTADRDVMILAAMVTILVEALSMASGQYVSEESVHELAKHKTKDNLLVSSGLMFGSYLIGGAIPLLPVLLLPTHYMITGSLSAAVAGLFLLGWCKSFVSGAPKLRSALEVVIIGGLSAAVGLVAGLLFQTGT